MRPTISFKTPMKTQFHNKCSGFTLIELVVVLFVFTGITALMLANFPEFANRTTLNIIAQELALTARQAQVYGTSIREATPGSDSFPAYGLNLDFGMFSGDITEYIFFTDTFPDPDGNPITLPNGNSEYDGNLDCGASPECVEKVFLGNEYVVSGICGIRNIGESCIPLVKLDITYLRPSTDAVIWDGTNLYAVARITVKSPAGYTKDVLVWKNGQISIE